MFNFTIKKRLVISIITIFIGYVLYGFYAVISNMSTNDFFCSLGAFSAGVIVYQTLDHIVAYYRFRKKNKQ